MELNVSASLQGEEVCVEEQSANLSLCLAYLCGELVSSEGLCLHVKGCLLSKDQCFYATITLSNISNTLSKPYVTEILSLVPSSSLWIEIFKILKGASS